MREFVLAFGDSGQMWGMKGDFDFCASADTLTASVPCELQLQAFAIAQSR